MARKHAPTMNRHPTKCLRLFTDVRLCSLSVMEHIVAVSPFNVKLLRRRIAFAITEGREERGDAEIITSHSVPPYLRLLRVLRRRQWCGG